MRSVYFKTALAAAGGSHQWVIVINAIFLGDKSFFLAHNLVAAQSLVPHERPGNFLYQCIFASQGIMSFDPQISCTFRIAAGIARSIASGAFLL